MTFMVTFAVLKPFAPFKLFYPFTVLPNPPQTLIQLIIWDNKTESKKRETLTLPIELEVDILPTALLLLKVSFVKKLFIYRQ